MTNELQGFNKHTLKFWYLKGLQHDELVALFSKNSTMTPTEVSIAVMDMFSNTLPVEVRLHETSAKARKIAQLAEQIAAIESDIVKFERQIDILKSEKAPLEERLKKLV